MTDSSPPADTPLSPAALVVRTRIITLATECERVHSERQRVDELYNLMTESSGLALRKCMHGLRAHLTAKFKLELEDPMSSQFRTRFESFFARINSNETHDRYAMLGMLFDQLVDDGQMREYFCSNEDTQARVDRRAFATWEREWLVPAVEDFRDGVRHRNIAALVDYLVTAYSRLLSADPRRHPLYTPPPVDDAPPPPPKRARAPAT